VSSELFIRRPVLTTLLMSAIVIFGVMAYRLLPVNDLPNVDFPTIQVSALLPGASAETMASAVATPLERQFTTIAGIDSMTSTSALGATQITIQFTLSRDIDGAAQDVQAAIAKAAPLLPPGMPTPPTYQKVNPADQPVIYLALSSPTLPLYTVDEYAQTNLAQRISTISGVAQVTVFGSQKYAVRVQVDPRALTAQLTTVRERLGGAIVPGEHPVLAATATELGEYFGGTRQHFDLPVRQRGSPFQMRVWHALCEIPYGRTRSYADIARRVGSPDAVRAVGAANGRNQVVIVVPCHRVIRADGSLCGYGGGRWRKQWLLDHERRRGAGPAG